MDKASDKAAVVLKQLCKLISELKEAIIELNVRFDTLEERLTEDEH